MTIRKSDLEQTSFLWKQKQFLEAFVIILIVISSLAPGALACINPIDWDSVGKAIEIENVAPSEFLGNLLSHASQRDWEGTLEELKRQQKIRSTTENRQNIAVSMLHLGQIDDAIQILKQLEKEKPGLYHTAANLGTAYELGGENQKALDWIKEGIKRNKNAHNGTEWLHVKILEAKLALEKDPDWLKKNSVLGVDFSVENVSPQQIAAVDHLGQRRDLSQIEIALVYQLHERLEFIKPQEPVVADLLYDLARVFALTRTAEHAAAVRDLALTYGSDRELSEAKMNSEKIVSGYSNPLRTYLVYGGVGILCVLVVLVGFYLKRRKPVR